MKPVASWKVASFLLAMSLQGCATPNVEWIAEQDVIHCLNEEFLSCLTGYSVAQISNWSEPELSDKAPPGVEDLILALAIIREPSESVRLDDSPGLMAAHQAGLVLTEYLAQPSDDLLAAIVATQQMDLKAKLLFMLWSSSHASLPQHHSAAILNVLYELDLSLYARAQSLRLPNLLAVGDFERAAALRDEILSTKSAPTTSMSLLAYISGTYAAVGLEIDAANVLRRAVSMGATVTEDELLLIRMLIRVGKGDYPPPQDFMFFEDDGNRIEAYAAMAQVAHSFGFTQQSEAALRDALKVIQKTSFREDVPLALSKIILASASIAF